MADPKVKKLHLMAELGGLVKSVNGTIPDEAGNVTIDIPNEVPDNPNPHQQLVTDSEGNVKWEDRTHYRSGLITATLNSSNAFVSENGEYGRYGEEPYNSADPETKATWGKIENDIWVHFNEIWAGNSERRPLVFYWDGVRFETPLVFRLPFIYNGLENGLPHMQFFQSGQTAKIRIGYNEPGEHTLSYEARDYQLKQLDEDFIPDTIARKTDIPDAIINPSTASVGQTLVVKSVDENGKPTEWETIDIPNEVPDNPNPHQQLVTDAEGNVKWEDRTHYSYSELAVILPETTISGKKSAVLNQYSQFSQNLVSDHEYTIVYNGTEYKCKTQYSDILCTNVLGNMSLASLGSDTGEPFFFNAVYNSEMTFVYFNTEGDHVISINDGEVENVSRLDTKYLPTTVPVIQSAQVGQTVMVKVVDENGKPTEWETSSILSELEARGYIKVIQFMDGTSFGMPLQCNMTPEEIISSITGDGVLAVYRRIYLDDRDLVDVYTCNIGSVIAANGSNRARKIDFNDGSAPIIVDASNNTITLDPDWVAPPEVALKSDVDALSERHYITRVTFEDNRALGVTSPLYSLDASSLISLFRDTTKSIPIVTREVWRMGNSEKALRLQMRSYALWWVDDDYKVRMHFGEEYPDIIANSADNTYVYDPDWVAPAEVALKSDIPTDMVKTINGVEPDEAGNVDLCRTEIVTFSDYSKIYSNPNYVMCTTHDINGLKELLNSINVNIVFSRTVFVNMDPFASYVREYTGMDMETIDGGAIYRIYFGDDLCPMIINTATNKIATDPDWTAPEEMALKSDIPTDEHINELISTALASFTNAEEVSY